ncbi:hypothetical protein IH601_00865 [Candidatus Bipolaricaulota bacterium]|jgi:predicted GNAT superfamily acetyltransferase|nr:hypothetical protein [Candidatus Bipolaricaulota bacterium]
MSIAVETLHSVQQLRGVVALQQQSNHEHPSEVWRLSHLLDIHQSGGLILGTPCSSMNQQLQGTLVDLVAEVDGYPARRTVVWAVDLAGRNRGIGSMLRMYERIHLQREGVDLVYWDIDPLSSVDLHLALNKLGGIATAYSCEAPDELDSSLAMSIPADRFRIEWWIDSPRVIDRIDHGHAPPHQSIGLHEMVVLTKTATLSSGVRGLLACTPGDSSEYLLIEVPEDLDVLRSRDAAAAIQWREKTRAVLAQRFQLGYQGVGLIHEAGRSFILFKKGTRRTALGAARD